MVSVLVGTGELVNTLASHMTPLHESALDCHAPIVCRALLARASCFAFNQRPSIMDARAKILGSVGTLGITSDAVKNVICEDEPAFYLGDDNADD